MTADFPLSAKSKPTRRWYQYSLRSLLIFVTLAGSGFGWFGKKVWEARQQQAAVAVIERAGGIVWYDYQYDQSGIWIDAAEPPGPACLRKLLADDFFTNVTDVDFSGPDFTDTGLESLKNFPHLHGLSLTFPKITDAGLVNLKGLTQLLQLDLRGTDITDAGLVNLKGLTQLLQLDLRGTEVTDAGLVNLKGLTKLQSLDLTATNVTDAGEKNLQEALPSCTIDR